MRAVVYARRSQGGGWSAPVPRPLRYPPSRPRSVELQCRCSAAAVGEASGHRPQVDTGREQFGRGVVPDRVEAGASKLVPGCESPVPLGRRVGLQRLREVRRKREDEGVPRELGAKLVALVPASGSVCAEEVDGVLIQPDSSFLPALCGTFHDFPVVLIAGPFHHDGRA